MRLHESRLARALACASMLVSVSPLPVMAQAAQRAPASAVPDVESTLQSARESIKNGRYDEAIEALKGVVGQPQRRTETLREAYLLLIKAFVYLGNDSKGREQGREASLLHYEKARALITECLRVRELRHTRPEPESDYPEQMVQFFKDVRAELFGSFRVTEVSPAGAVVLFDADTLRNEPGSTVRGDTDLAAGQKHMVIVRYPGYRDVTEEITIQPGATPEKTYQLTKPRGLLWYTSGAALVLAGGAAAIFGRKSGETTPAPEPLGGPPPPPTRPQ